MNMIIINLYLRNRTYRPIKLKYNINYNTITFLCSAYLHYIYINKVFSYTGIYLLCGYFNARNSRTFLNKLIDCKMITLAGNRKYTLTDIGLNVIKELEDSYNTVMYKFCSLHNIDL